MKILILYKTEAVTSNNKSTRRKIVRIVVVIINRRAAVYYRNIIVLLFPSKTGFGSLSEQSRRGRGIKVKVRPLKLKRLGNQ